MMVRELAERTVRAKDPYLLRQDIESPLIWGTESTVRARPASLTKCCYGRGIGRRDAGPRRVNIRSSMVCAAFACISVGG